MECPGGINESLGGPNCGSSDICLSWASKICSASCTNSFILAFCVVPCLGISIIKYLHVGVYYLDELSGHRRTHRSNVHRMHNV